MNGLGKPLRKNVDLKSQKYNKNQSEIAACEQKTTRQKANSFSNSVISFYFKIGAKNFTPHRHSFFCSTSCFVVTKNHYPNLTSKTMKRCEQILKRKKYSGTSADVQFTEFAITKPKIRPRTDYEWIGKSI